MSWCEMEKRVYTVKQIARMAGVGIKTLHHYHAIGLLPPYGLSAAGYRLYAREQLETLQQILFYRRLGFPLKHIRNLLDDKRDRLAGLRDQRARLLRQQEDVARLVATIDRTIASIERGDTMPDQDLFEGFHSEAEWNAALADHNAHVKATYDTDVAPVTDVNAMNEAAARAAAFMKAMAAALRQKQKADAPEVRELVGAHVTWLVSAGHAHDAKGFAAQTRFFLEDDFHRDMLETQQTGLAYYLNAAAEAYTR